MIHRVLLLFVGLAALVSVAAGCGGGSGSGVPKGAVAVVGGEEVTREQFDELVAQAERSYKAGRRPFPKAGSQEYRALQGQAVQFLVQRLEYEQKAKELGIEIADKQIEDRLKQIKKQYFGGNEKRYQAQLEQQGLSDAQIRADLRAQLISEAIFDKVTIGAFVTDAEVEQYYKTHPKQFETPESRSIRHILVKTEKEADEVYAALQSGSDFSALAKKLSLDPGSKKTGGKLTITRGQTVKPFDEVAFTLETGALSKPVKTQYGWHVIEALEPVRPKQVTGFKGVKGSIRAQLLQQKRGSTMASWTQATKREFCDGKLEFAVGFTPAPDPCAPAASTTTSP